MCAILDACACGDVFGKKQTEAGKDFYKWLSKGKGKLVTGGKLYDEMKGNRRYLAWLNEALGAGKAKREPNDSIAAESSRLEGRCLSNDFHVIALARVGGARLLYSKDKRLHKDFKDKKLLRNPRGKVLPEGATKKESADRRRLLSMKDLCRC